MIRTWEQKCPIHIQDGTVGHIWTVGAIHNQDGTVGHIWILVHQLAVYSFNTPLKGHSLLIYISLCHVLIRHMYK